MSRFAALAGPGAMIPAQISQTLHDRVADGVPPTKDGQGFVVFYHMAMHQGGLDGTIYTRWRTLQSVP